LHRARSFLVGRTPSRYETAIDVINAKWFIENNSLPKDHLRQSIAEYKITGIDDVTRVAEDHIGPDHLTIVVVGDADKIKTELEDIAPVTVVKK
jgi:zinc protease